MRRASVRPESLSVGQLARRWAVDRQRVEALIRSGNIEGVFVIPAAGRFGQARRIPLWAVLKAEQEWTTLAIHDEPSSRRKPPRGVGVQTLRHLPELNALPQAIPASRDVGSLEDEQH